MTPNMQYAAEGGFVAHNGGPSIEAPRDWMVWHFTRLDYLPEIIDDGRLMCDDDVTPRAGSVANADVKALRRQRVINAPGYPSGRRVSQHVPFYIAAKSPMLYVVSKQFPRPVVDSLVFFGVQVQDVIDADLEWVASNGNAATALTQFSAEVDSLGTFVDFALLGERDWYNTPDDTDRKSRRSAEVLVFDCLPLEAVSWVAASNDVTLRNAQDQLDAAGYGDIQYWHTSAFTY